ncbi:hypothetical protein I656_00008 [Geobacillus sp. WSUCF1]|nr:hypothetical protein I656_00008 [Geobacillus sp. WSUCF1]
MMNTYLQGAVSMNKIMIFIYCICLFLKAVEK